MTAIHARFSSTTVDGIKSQTTGSRFSETTQRPSVASNNTYNNAKSRQEKQRVNNRCRGNKLPPTPKEWRERITDFYLIPDGPFLSRWNAWMVAVTTASHLLITFMAAFHIHSLYGFIAGFFIDVIFLVDMYFKSHTAYLSSGFWVVFPKEMRSRYFSSWTFKFDALSNFPYELVSAAILGPILVHTTIITTDSVYSSSHSASASLSSIIVLIRLIKLLRTIRCYTYFTGEERKLHASVHLQVAKFATYLVIITHSVACVWMVLACPGGQNMCLAGSWVSLVGHDGSLVSSSSAPNGGGGSSSIVVVGGGVGVGGLNTDPLLAGIQNAVDKMMNSSSAGNQKRITVQFSGASNKAPVYLNYVLSVETLYAISVYWSVATMTTTGYGDIHATNDMERLFSALTMTFGIFFYGYVSGTIASHLANKDSRRVSYRQKMEAVQQYMDTRDMEPTMQNRVLEYYDYLWERNKGIDVGNMFEDMPVAFKSEVAISLNDEIISKAAIFQTCSQGFRRRIAVAMRLQLFTAHEYIVHKGDLGLEMYFITQGRVDVYSSDYTKKPKASLIEGGHFGEYGLILGHRHENSALAICNTDVYVLTHDALAAAFDAYPEDRQRVEVATRDQYARDMAKLVMRMRRTRRTYSDIMRLIDEDDDNNDVGGGVMNVGRSVGGVGGGGGGAGVLFEESTEEDNLAAAAISPNQTAADTSSTNNNISMQQQRYGQHLHVPGMISASEEGNGGVDLGKLFVNPTSTHSSRNNQHHYNPPHLNHHDRNGSKDYEDDDGGRGVLGEEEEDEEEEFISKEDKILGTTSPSTRNSSVVYVEINQESD